VDDDTGERNFMTSGKQVVVRTIIVVLAAVLFASAWGRAQEPAPQTITIVTSGTGADEKAAIKQALSNAVQQAVGTIVDAETVVKNDQIIREQILTASNAIVASYDPVGKPRLEAGLVTVTVKAVVEKQGLTARLAKANIVKAEVRGQDLFAQVVTQLEKEKDAAKIVPRVFQDFPGSVLKAEPVGQPEILNKAEGTIGVRVRFSVDMTKYDAWQKAYLPFLKRIGTKYERLRSDPNKDIKATSLADEARKNQFTNVPEQDRKDSFMGTGEWLPDDAYKKPSLTIIERTGSSVAHLIYLDQEIMDQIGTAMCALPVVELLLRDKDDKEIDGYEHVAVFGQYDRCCATVFFSTYLSGREYPFPTYFQETFKLDWKPEGKLLHEKQGIVIAPYLQGVDRGRSAASDCRLMAFEMVIPFKIGVERLKDIKTVEVKISSRNNAVKNKSK
jgi:hypothetical protein